SNGNSKVRLAITEQNAIDGGEWEAAGGHAGQRNPFAVDLTVGGGQLDKVSFTSDNVDAVANTITINPGIGPVEFGQKVIYREDGIDPKQQIGQDNNGAYVYVDANGNPMLDGNGQEIPYTPLIPGLIHNTGYWVLSSPNQYGLQGDNRLADKQVIQLGALEN